MYALGATVLSLLSLVAGGVVVALYYFVITLVNGKRDEQAFFLILAMVAGAIPLGLATHSLVIDEQMTRAWLMWFMAGLGIFSVSTCLWLRIHEDEPEVFARPMVWILSGFTTLAAVSMVVYYA